LWPAQIHDTKAAIRWVRANAAKIGIDADKIAIAGYSAGGMLSLLAAERATWPMFEGNGGNAESARRFRPVSALSACEYPDRR
jgi:dienelactone hydrolase